MAVATKTLTPTNQVVNLPDMTEPPDNSVNVDNAGKLADAVNALDNNKLNGINTQGNNRLELRNTGGVMTFISHATTPSADSPSIWIDLNTSNKNINFYKDAGNGWILLGTLQIP